MARQRFRIMYMPGVDRPPEEIEADEYSDTGTWMDFVVIHVSPGSSSGGVAVFGSSREEQVLRVRAELVARVEKVDVS